ncbi:putative E3 ubiquitin-protein ligase HERC1 [Stylophora pistillata]|uniref:Putative E3 ubiquitin-protein ligase HERC1 n=1 Tax=Stylophora pistillata TaxID=50429 RepID=A0A2B4R5Z7_STYPI|nr:putative E3 ubiquitin-protein ligase HERC1 [Stylophora pistillata]
MDRLGQGDTLQQTRPVYITELSDKKCIAVMCGHYRSMAQSADNWVWWWGWGVYGQLGVGSIEDALLPAHVQALDQYQVTKLAAGYSHSAVLTAQSRVKRIDCGYELSELLSGRGGSADTVVDVATVEFRFGPVVLAEKLMFDKTYKKIGIARSHFGAHGYTIAGDKFGRATASRDNGQTRVVSYELFDRILDGVLIAGGEVFVDLLIKRGVRKLPQSFFSVESKGEKFNSETLAPVLVPLIVDKRPKEVVERWELEISEQKAKQDCVKVKALFASLEQLIRAKESS